MDFLPTEVLLEIFNFLSSSDLQNVAYSCQRFYDLITMSPKLIRKFTVEIINDKRNYLLSVENYQNAIVQGRTNDIYNFQLLEKFSATLKTLSFHEVTFESINQFGKVLENMTNLQSIELDNCGIVTFNEINVEPFEIPALRELAVNRGQ